MKISIEHMGKSFDKHEALKDITMHIESGTIHGVLGSNGAGKTTLLKSMVGIYQVDYGAIKYGDYENSVFDQPNIKDKVIFLADIPHFFKGASLSSMSEFYQHLYPNWSGSRYKKLIEHFSFNDKKPLNQVSKGMKRQAAFILAFSARPEVMILDEPFDGLDPIIRSQVKSIMMQDIAAHGMTIVASSHNLREMEDICDSVSILHNGALLFHKEMSDMKAEHSKVQIAFKTMPDDDFFKSLDVVHHTVRGRVMTCIVKGSILEIEKKITQYPHYMYDILPLTLEEIFAYEMGGMGYEIKNIILE